jgi:hypothetical protein
MNLSSHTYVSAIQKIPDNYYFCSAIFLHLLNDSNFMENRQLFGTVYDRLMMVFTDCRTVSQKYGVRLEVTHSNPLTSANRSSAG